MFEFFLILPCKQVKLYGLLDKITKDDAKTIKSFLMGLDTVILPNRYHYVHRIIEASHISSAVSI